MDALHWFQVILAGYLFGSIPFGYLIVRAMRGIDVREFGSHNIGATNVLRVVGRGPALLTLLGDVLKGVLPPVLAAGPMTGGEVIPTLVVLAALAAVLGHAYSIYFLVKERRFARGKAVATGLGAIIGFALAGQISWLALAGVAAVWFGTVFGPRLVSRNFGYVSLGSIAAALSMPLLFLLTGAALPLVLFGVAAGAFVTWKHKENLGRLLDRVEPRLGEKPPLAGIDEHDLSCAFMIHAITPDDWWQTRRFAWAKGLFKAGLIPLGVMRRASLLIRPMKLDTIRGVVTPDGRRLQVHLICVPWLPADIKGHPELAVRRCVQSAELARDLGARCMGLGAYWSVVGQKGKEVARRAPFIPITNGGAYTAGTVRQAVPLVEERLRKHGLPLAEARAVVVGATGVVGFGICRQLAGRVRELVLIGTDLERVQRSARLLRRRLERAGQALPTRLVCSTDIGECATANVIFTATSHASPVLHPEHVQPGAVIYDMGRPADVAPEVTELPGVVVIPGGVVRPPGRIEAQIDCHFGEGLIPACMAETLLLALDGCYEKASLGDVTRADSIDYFVELAGKYGFEVVEAVVPASARSGAEGSAGRKAAGSVAISPPVATGKV